MPFALLGSLSLARRSRPPVAGSGFVGVGPQCERLGTGGQQGRRVFPCAPFQPCEFCTIGMCHLPRTRVLLHLKKITIKKATRLLSM